MWPALLVAAAAGSGFLAKKILNQNASEPPSGSTENDCKCDKDSSFTSNLEEIYFKCDGSTNLEEINTSFQQKNSSFACNLGFGIQEQNEGLSDASIFRFSSASGSEMGHKYLRKINGEGSRKPKGNVRDKLRIKCGNVRDGERVPRIYVCLKKRRTNKVPSGKCDCCASKGNSFFGWGLGIGMMCMMSVGKSEMNRLNTTVSETSKVVQELKDELSSRKNAHDLYASDNKAETSEKNSSECGSNVVTEEQQQPQAMEMDQLEAELQSELQKLPWFADFDGGSNPCKDEFLEKEIDQTDDHTHEFSGVLPSELDQKLCHLLIEQQESQIVKLESELCKTHSKLNEKESELQALKDCVRRLTEFSIASAPGEETDAKVENEMSGGGDQQKEVGPESRKSILGMKRSMNF